MEQPTFDPGITNQFGAPVRRIINKDGSFNVHRKGVTWRDVHPYLFLINMSWPGFFAVVFSAYVVVNLFFALGYYAIGAAELQGSDAATQSGRFANDFFF